MAHSLGIDLGSSSVKVSLLDVDSGQALASAQSPQQEELPMDAPQLGWAEQDPEVWWSHVALALDALAQAHPLAEVRSIGIAYQMHGLVVLDADGNSLRPSIIWCDSRAISLGKTAFAQLGEAYISTHTLNSPGNFTASKWAWVAQHQPELLARAKHVLLPGDYLAYRLTGVFSTTNSGLSEMALWDFHRRCPAQEVLQTLGLDEALLPARVPSFGEQEQVKPSIAARFGFRQNPSVCYRAGDQPNNAYSLNVCAPGDTAATAGTSGVVYGVSANGAYDRQQRVNTFLHVTDTPSAERLGILLCINGTGSAYSWLRRTLSATTSVSYDQINTWAEAGGIAPDGLLFFPFGNGAERMLGQAGPGAQFSGLRFNRHGAPEWSAAVQDGIAAALAYGTEAFGDLGAAPKVIRAGQANLFQSDRFCQAFCQLTDTPLELFNTDGAQGAARGAAVGAGLHASHQEALSGLAKLAVFEPRADLQAPYQDLYRAWRSGLSRMLSS